MRDGNLEIFSLGYALLSTQHALLGIVTPELRAVVVDFVKGENLLYMRFYYDGALSEKYIDLWQCAITEASAALGPDCILDDGVDRLDYPKAIPVRGRCAYLRKEPILLILAPKSINHTNTTVITREIVNFKEIIGVFISPDSGERINTSWGIMHRATDGCHVVPARPLSHKIDTFPVAYAELAMCRGLLGSITPELRAVFVDAVQEKQLLYMRMYYEGAVPESILALWECAITETAADFGPGWRLDAAVERLDYPQHIPESGQGRYAYFRKE